MKHEMLTRAQADGRIRGAARVAACFCWVAALVVLLLALFNMWSTVFLTTASMRESGRDVLTAFFTTSGGAPGFVIQETETGTAYLSGSPVSTLANGVVFGGLACAAFARAALMCSKIRRTGVPFAPERARELGRVGWLVLLAGCAPALLHMLLERMAMAVIDSLIAAGEMVRYSLTASFGPQELMLVTLGILLVLVGRVFEYGCILQQQDDETL